MEQIVTPENVQGATLDGVHQAVDYAKLVQQFGAQLIDDDLLARFENLTGRKPHRFLRRGLFFSHRDLNKILDRYEQGKPFYLYTGRGPGAGSMHLGHLIPFLFCKWLQEVFNCVLVIQLTDDEKYIFAKGDDMKLDDSLNYALDNAKDIMSFGFDPKKTFIFSNLNYMNPAFYQNVVRISKCITASASKATFGFIDSDNIGKLHFVSVQSAPALSSTFPELFCNKQGPIPCLIPCAVDQDAYFRHTRDVAGKLKHPKPALIHAKFFPALQGLTGKMSASNEQSAIYLRDSPSQIRKKINSFAFSGGRATVEEHRELGGDCEVDVSYQYLRFLLEDDAELLELRTQYSNGKLLTGDLKERCINVLQSIIAELQEARKNLTQASIDAFLSPIMDV